MSGTLAIAARLYRLALRLYPALFYDQFADDMAADFRDGCAAATREGRSNAAMYVFRAVADLVVSLVAQWIRTEGLVVAAVAGAAAFVAWGVALWIASREWPDGPVMSTMQLALLLAAGSSVTAAIARWNASPFPSAVAPANVPRSHGLPDIHEIGTGSTTADAASNRDCRLRPAASTDGAGGAVASRPER
jgi:hypothetical protein